MTVIVHFTSEVNLKAVFPLLDVTRIPLEEPKRKRKKIRIPECKIPGSVLCVLYDGVARGITKGNSFRNSIIIDISTGSRNVSLKLSKSNIQMCGAKSMDLVLESVGILLEHLNVVQDKIDYLRDHRDEAERVLKFFEDTFKGHMVLFDGLLQTEFNIHIPNINMEECSEEYIELMKNWNDPNPYIRAEALKQYPCPEGLDPIIFKIFMDQVPDFAFHDDFMMQARWVLDEATHAIDRDIGILMVNKVMINHNFDLGFSLDRAKLAELINGMNGYVATYDNCIDKHVNIKKVCEEDGVDRSLLKKKNKIRCHSFRVFMGGSVTQSSPSEVTMKDAYYDFRNTIESIRSLIEIDSSEPRYIQYIPIDRIKPNNVGPDEYTRFIDYDMQYENVPENNDQAEVLPEENGSIDYDTSYTDDYSSYAL
uniref:Uncharacterized protein n=1 Tax=viral metagenome TaxID=1070528 RepID=A0A6C0BLG2_9ZZZZ